MIITTHKLLEIELPNITQAQEDYLLDHFYAHGLEEVMKIWINDHIGLPNFSRETKGFETFNEFYIAYYYGYTVVKGEKNNVKDNRN